MLQGDQNQPHRSDSQTIVPTFAAQTLRDARKGYGINLLVP